MWATALPCDLLLDIFCRLESTAIIRCAGVCRPWRRAIIDNARCLRPRPDRFLPDLLLAFLDYYCHLRRHTTMTTLGRPENDVPSAENVLAMESVVAVGPYPRPPLASRDGFLLFKICDKMLTESLCLCNPLAGICRFLSIDAVDKILDRCSYVLATAYDDDSHLPEANGAGGSDVRILAVKGEENWMTYQIFSSTSGVWGPVKRSAKLIEEDLAKVFVLREPRYAVVCGGSVAYLLVCMLSFATDEEGDYRACLFAMDTRTERTWTTELPEDYMNMDNVSGKLALATSEDGRRPSLVVSKSHGVRHEIEVWVLAGEWTLQRTMDLQSWLFPYRPHRGEIWLGGFFPRSGCLFAIAITDYSRQQFLIGVDGSSPRLIETDDDDSEFRYFLQYEMDWSTYISRMEYL